MASTTAQVSLSNTSSAGPGTTIDFTTAKRNVTMVLNRGSATGGLIAMEASQDGTNWVSIYLFAGDKGAPYYSHTGGAFRYWRANVLRSIPGGTVSATFMEGD